MENFKLQANESVLYRHKCRVVKKNEKYLESLSTNTNTEILLTNLNFVMITKEKKIFSKDRILVETYPVQDIKIYNNLPQVKPLNTRVEIYLKNEEKTIDFFSKFEAHKFTNKVFELLTGKTLTLRGADKVKSTVNLVDDTLGINTMDTIKNVVENGVVGTILGKGSKVNPKNNVFSEVLNITKDLVNKKTDNVAQLPKDSENDLDKQIESLNKLKTLLDNDIISQDEFNEKKKEILGL